LSLRRRGEESGIVFDVNLYGPGFLRGFSRDLNTDKLVLNGHVNRSDLKYGGVVDPTAQLWDVTRQMGWALTRLVLNSTDTECLAFRSTVSAYAMGLDALVGDEALGFQRFATGNLLTVLAPERVADFLAACDAGGGSIYRGGGRPIELLEEVVRSKLPPGAAPADVRAGLMRITNQIYEEKLMMIDERLRTFEAIQASGPTEAAKVAIGGKAREEGSSSEVLCARHGL
jgi:hypothetical protein